MDASITPTAPPSGSGISFGTRVAIALTAGAVTFAVTDPGVRAFAGKVMQDPALQQRVTHFGQALLSVMRALT